MKRRNIWLIVAVALVTSLYGVTGLVDYPDSLEPLVLVLEIAWLALGVLYIVWQCGFQGELRELTGQGFSVWGHFWMSILTFGIYTAYWHYAAAKRLHQLGAKDRSSLYLTLSLVSLAFSLIDSWFAMDVVEQILAGDLSVSSSMPPPLRIVSLFIGLIPYAIFMMMLNDANKLPPKVNQ